MEYIAKKIQELRLKRNMSQGDLADKLGISRQAVSKWEREEGLPDLYNIKKLAEIFKVSVDELVMDGSNIVIDYRNKTSVFLMSIPIAIITLSILVLLYYIASYGIFFIQAILSLGRMNLGKHLQWVFVPIGFIISLILVETFINMLSNNKVGISRLLSIIMYSSVLAISLTALLAFNLQGFSIIFLYIFGFIIISVGLVGTILFHKEIRLHTRLRENKIVNIVMKALKVILLSYISIFTVSAIQTYVLTKPLIYFHSYSSESIDESFYMSVDQGDLNLDIWNFNIHIVYLIELDQDVQNPYVKIYMGEKLIAEGALVNSVSGDYNYKYEMDQSNYEMPLLIIENDELINNSLSEIEFILTYELTGSLYTETVLPIFRENSAIIGSIRYENMWVWNYKDYISS